MLLAGSDRAHSDRIHAVGADRPDESGHYVRDVVKILNMSPPVKSEWAGLCLLAPMALRFKRSTGLSLSERRYGWRTPMVSSRFAHRRWSAVWIVST
jgi:hypothetical protein